MKKSYLLLLILFSCVGKSAIEQDIIEIDISYDKEYLSELSDFFTSIEYILLEDSDENHLVQPYKIISYDTLIFVEDQELDNLLIYNRLGKFLFALKSSGGGPQEFNQIEDFQVFENSIIIKDNVLMKFIEFDFSGKFIQEFRHQLLSMNFIKTQRYQLHFFNNVIQNEPFNFLRINESDSTYEIPIQEGYEGMVLVHQNGFTHSKNGLSSYLSLPFSYDVFQFSSDGEFQKRLRFNLNAIGLSDEERLKVEKEKKEPAHNEFALMIRSFFPVNNGFFFNYTSNLEKTYLGFLDANYKLTKISINPTNDLDGVPLIFVPWSYHENGLILKIPSRRFAQLVKNRRPSSEMKSNLVSFLESHTGELSSDRHVLVYLNQK